MAPILPLFMSDSPPEPIWNGLNPASARHAFSNVSIAWPMTTPFPPSAHPQPTDGDGMELVRAARKAIDGLSQDIEGFRFNRAVAQLHALANAIADTKEDTLGCCGAALRCRDTGTTDRATFCCRGIVGNSGASTMLADSSWPTTDNSLIADNIIKIGVQLMANCGHDLAGARLPQREAGMRHWHHPR